jgi:spore maturation protein CgeB
MKVLLAFNLHANGDPERGFSYEYHNLYLPLQHIAADVVPFDFATLCREHGVAAMNEALIETLRREQPDVSIFALVKDEFLPHTIVRSREYTKTVGYFFDDIWRRDYVAEWAPRFDFFTTPIWSRYQYYLSSGLGRPLYSPFGYNEHIYQKMDRPARYDVSFVGGGHPWRSFVVDRLRRAGFAVAAFGPFWPAGRLEQEDMVETYNSSRINLNLSNARQWDARYLFSSWRALRNTVRTPKVRDGIKGRHFEISGCGGFQLTYYCEDLERHYRIGEEIAVYLDVDDLLEKVEYYLSADSERETIAAAGHERAALDHTASRRLEDLLSAVLSAEDVPSDASTGRHPMSAG